MRSKKPKLPIESEFEVVIRKRNQLTLPGAALSLLDVKEGDRLVIEFKDDSATLRPVRRSLAGVLHGVYGDAGEFVSRERKTWR